MLRTIVVDSEYLVAAENYKEAGNRVHDAVEHFKRCVRLLVEKKAIAGKTATNMISFLAQMTTILRATFKEQTLYEAALCGEYLKQIDNIDRSKSYSKSTKGVQNMSFSSVSVLPYPTDMLIIDIPSINDCISQLKSGPIQDIRTYISRIKNISFSESAGPVKEQNIAVRDKAVSALMSLQTIFSVYIAAIEKAVNALHSADSFTAFSVLSGKPA